VELVRTSFFSIPVKARTNGLFVATMLVTLAALMLSASASAVAADPSRTEFGIAYATFEHQDGCITTRASVNAYDGYSLRPDTPTVSSAAIVQLSRFDGCTGESLLEAYGDLALTVDQFRFSETEGIAALQSDVVVTDAYTGQEIPLNVDVTWDAMSLDLEQRVLSHFRDPSLLSNYHDDYAIWRAEADGVISEDGTNLATTLSSASLVSDDLGSLLIEREQELAGRLAFALGAGSDMWFASGESAFAQWQSSDISTCVRTDISLGVSNLRGVGIPFNSSINLWLLAYDYCSGQVIRSVSGYELLPEGEFVVRSAFGSASVNRTFLGFDSATGETVPIAVNLDWKGEGTPSLWQLTIHSALFNSTAHNNERWRSASLSGTVAIGGVAVDDPVVFAQLRQFDTRAADASAN
jgi:hypothetical protein